MVRSCSRAVVGFVAALGVACSGGGDSKAAAASVVTRAPSPGVADTTSATVTVVFSEPMDAASLQTGFTVALDGGGAIAGSVAVAADTATFTPTSPFPPAASLTATLSAEVRSARGGRLGSPVSWSFTTAHWRPIATAGASVQIGPAVWTGTEMVAWNGANAGARYNPATDRWRPNTTANQPEPRTGHAAVWTGAEMIVWGGLGGAGGTQPIATGGRYDPVADTWQPISTAGAPSARSGHTAVWTGTEMIVWGGVTDLSGAIYDPASDTWRPMSTTDAPVIPATHRAVWTGSQMAVWGGTIPRPPDGGGIIGACLGPGCGPTEVAVGGLYDPATDTWTPISTSNAPAARSGHVLAWTGTELLVTGGTSAGATGGGRYDPATRTWTQIADAGAPSARSWSCATWTGNRLLVWSGYVAQYVGTPALLADGAVYDPATDTWAPMPAAGAAPAQFHSASVWTGTELIVWGGDTAATGARFTP